MRYETNETFFLDGYLIDPSRNTVAGPSGETTIEPRVMAVLCLLAEKSKQVIHREDIISQVWRTEYGGDESLTRAISILRRTFGDTHGRRQFIETIPRRGYRLAVEPRQGGDENAELAPVRDISSARQDNLFTTRRLATGLGAVVVLIAALALFPRWRETAPAVDENGAGRVAIADFLYSDPDSGNSIFADGLRRALIRNFLTVKLEIVNQTAPAKFLLKGEIGLREGERVIRIRIEERETGIGLWSGEFLQTDLTEAELQESVANSIATQMQCMTRRSAAGAVPRDYARFLLSACHVEERWKPEFRLTAMRMADIAPDEAPAHALKALSFAIPAAFSSDTEKQRAAYAETAIAAAEEALALDADNAEAITAKALIYLKRGRIAEAERSLRQAIKIDPEYPLSRHYLHAHILFHTGQVAAARRVNYESVALDPLNLRERTFEAFYDIIYHVGRGYASEIGPQILDYIEANGIRSEAAALRFQYEAFYGDPEQARILLASDTPGFNPSDENLNCAALIIDARAAGQKPDAGDLLSTCNPNSHVFYAPRLLAMSGDVDLLYSSYEQMTNKLHMMYSEVWTPEWAAFRSDPRFMDFAARNGLAQYWLETGAWPDFCESQEDLQYDCRQSAAAAVKSLL